MQITIRGRDQPWIYINFQLVSIIFYTIILSVPSKYHLFTPIVIAFMFFNSSFTSWESWCSGIVLLIFYYSLNYIKNNTKSKFPFSYILPLVLFPAFFTGSSSRLNMQSILRHSSNKSFISVSSNCLLLAISQSFIPMWNPELHSFGTPLTIN
jgi:hypothetical protein